MTAHRLAVFVTLGSLALSSSIYATEKLEAEPTVEPLSPVILPVPVWRSLHYHGRNWIGRMTAQLEIQQRPLHEDSTEAPSATRGIAMLRTRFKSLVLANRSSFLRAVFDRSTGAVINFTKLSLGRRPDFKRYDFQPNGVDRLRREPDAGELSLPAEKWSASRRSFHAFVPGDHDCRLVSDPGAMAFLLSSNSARLNDSTEKARFCFFSGKTLYRVRFTDLGRSNPKVAYQIVKDGVRSKRSGRVEMDRYGILARPVAGKLDESPIRAELLIESDTRIPWRFIVIEGWLKVDVVLDQVVLGPPQSSRLSVTPLGDR